MTIVVLWRVILYRSFIIRMWENGLFVYLPTSQFLSKTAECQVDALQQEKMKPISLSDLTAHFFILGVEITISGLLFMAENFFYTGQKRKIMR